MSSAFLSNENADKHLLQWYFEASVSSVHYTVLQATKKVVNYSEAVLMFSHNIPAMFL